MWRMGEYVSVLMEFLVVSSLAHPLAEVGAVADDGFFDQALSVKLGFMSAQFSLDQWHLLDSGLTKMFGKGDYELLQGLEGDQTTIRD